MGDCQDSWSTKDTRNMPENQQERDREVRCFESGVDLVVLPVHPRAKVRYISKQKTLARGPAYAT